MEKDLESQFGKFVLSKEEKGKVSLDDSDVVGGLEECSRSLFGKIYGVKKVNFSGLRNVLMRIWPTRDPFSIKEVGNNSFQFLFRSSQDKNSVKNKQVWSFDNQYIILRDWSEGITDAIDSWHKIDMWIQVWNLPIHWISTATGFRIGQVFSTVYDVFVPESGSVNGRIIKIKAEVDLDKPLPRGALIDLNGLTRWVDFKFEYLKGFCYYCGQVGHSLRECEIKKGDNSTGAFKEGQFGEWMCEIKNK